MTEPFEYLDACPECGEHDCHPAGNPTWEGDGIRTTYCCPSCQHSWFTSWEPQNGESTSTFREAS